MFNKIRHKNKYNYKVRRYGLRLGKRIEDKSSKKEGK